MRNPFSRIHWFEIMLFIMALIFIIPIYVALVSTFKSYREVVRSPFALPAGLYFDNIVAVLFKYTDLPNAAWKSALISGICVAGVLVFAPMAAYRIMRSKGPSGQLMFGFFTAGMAIPFMVYMLPLLREIRTLGLAQTYPGLILIYLGNYVPFSVFLYCGFIKSVPYELEEAAEIDGCGPFCRYWRIVFPLLQPCHITAILLFCLFTWNDFAFAYMVMGVSKANLVFTEVYKLMSSTWNTQWNLILTGVVLASLPITVVYFFLQKQFMKGLTTGAVKG